MLEPRAPRPDLRLEAVRKLREAGIAAGVLAMPVLPGITDREEDLDALARGVRDAGAQWFAANVLFLMPASLKQFLPFLRREVPQASEAVWRVVWALWECAGGVPQRKSGNASSGCGGNMGSVRVRIDRGRGRGGRRRCNWALRMEGNVAQVGRKSKRRNHAQRALTLPAAAAEQQEEAGVPVRGVKLRTVSAFTMLFSLACLAAFMAGRPPLSAADAVAELAPKRVAVQKLANMDAARACARKPASARTSRHDDSRSFLGRVLRQGKPGVENAEKSAGARAAVRFLPANS